jgi:hypothetical protein
LTWVVPNRVVTAVPVTVLDVVLPELLALEDGVGVADALGEVDPLSVEVLVPAESAFVLVDASVVLVADIGL